MTRHGLRDTPAGPCLLMEYVAGGGLERRLQPGKPVAPAEAAVAKALAGTP